MKDQKLTWGELERSAQDREKWRRPVLALSASRPTVIGR
jgi:hypothetical protein